MASPSKVRKSTAAAKAWNRHEQLLAIKQLITSPPKLGTDMKYGVSKVKYTKGSSRRQSLEQTRKTSAKLHPHEWSFLSIENHYERQIFKAQVSDLGMGN
ncbi:4906_t:CDS:2 [Funneliformis caledonium]|uniref:4906_t:CDS:1 n=1 Tax=Funneliformis caledonium TaxID=1117310 RepID=A0A9N9ACM3_9GLOM|nr:4906_t:CDS:2 [Funneliformis caledonium]